MGGLSLNVWGPRAWHTLHAVAHKLPPHLDEHQKAQVRSFLLAFAALLPCKRCAAHFEQYLHEHMTDAALESRAAVVALLNDAHNAVNRRLGRREFTLAEHYDLFRRGRVPEDAARADRLHGRTPCVLFVVATSCCLLAAVRRARRSKMR